VVDQSKSENKGLAVVVIERFEQWILPRALEIKARVDRGERLSDYDIGFLEELIKDAEEVKRHVDRAPEYQTLYTGVISLYGEITKKALENEQAEKGGRAIGSSAPD
jgi:hypothetical protein